MQQTLMLEVLVTYVEPDQAEKIQEVIREQDTWSFAEPVYDEAHEWVVAHGVDDWPSDDLDAPVETIAKDILDACDNKCPVTITTRFLAALLPKSRGFGQVRVSGGVTAFEVMYGGNWKETTINLKRCVRDLNHTLNKCEGVEDMDVEGLKAARDFVKNQLDLLEKPAKETKETTDG